MDTQTLVKGLNSVISIPLIPYAGDQIDFEGHAKNIRYLMNNNNLSGDRPRVISIAGTSLIHHVSLHDQVKIIDIAGQQMGDTGILIAALMPNPLPEAGSLIQQMSKLKRPPDAYLIMPLTGTYSPDGLYETFKAFAEYHAHEHDARFLYYFRRPRDRQAVIRLLQDSPHFVGVKIGTDVSDVKPFVEALDDRKIVIWGIGDRSTDAAEQGAKGHTSGINIFVAKASDGINNAQCRGDYAAARQLEADISRLEDLRFMNERAYNYSAVMEAIIQSDLEDVVAGSGGPFNPRVPDDIADQIKGIVAEIVKYH